MDELTKFASLLGKRMLALAELILPERPFGGVHALLRDGLSFEKKSKSFLRLLFRECSLRFGQVLGMQSLADLVR